MLLLVSWAIKLGHMLDEIMGDPVDAATRFTLDTRLKRMFAVEVGNAHDTKLGPLLYTASDGILDGILDEGAPSYWQKAVTNEKEEMGALLAPWLIVSRIPTDALHHATNINPLAINQSQQVDKARNDICFRVDHDKGNTC